MKFVTKILAASIAASLAPVQAFALTPASGNIPFSGSVSNSCIITVGAPGILAASTDFTVVGSEEASGSAGTATILTTGAGYSLMADAPLSFSAAPPTGNDNVTFEANYSVTGANIIPQTDGATSSPLQRGNSSVSINMSGTKNVIGETFEEGTYAATVLLRCE
jgi:hypothetical protein